MDFIYIYTPFCAWLVSGILKFFINSLKSKRWAFDLIGYGGLPSNHVAIVSSAAALVAFREGIDHPAFGVAIALVFIVIIDASSLRRQVGHQATVINRMAEGILATPRLRERMGHTPVEIVAGFIVGCSVAFLITLLS